MTTNKKKTRWFFPVKTEEDALEAIKIAYQGTFALAAIQAAVFGGLMLYTGSWNGDIFDPVFMVGLGWALRSRKSRTAAVVLMIYSVLSAFLTLAARVGLPMTNFGGRNLILAVLFVYASYKGMQGAFAYHRLIGSTIRMRNLVLLCGVTFLYVLLYTFACFGVFLIPGLEPMISTLSESDYMLGLIWLGPSMAIIFAGGFGKLPGTKKLNVVTFGPQGAKRELSSHYIVKHWRGELPLVTSYWINTILVGIIFAIVSAVVEHSGIFQTNVLLGMQITALLILVSIPVYIWQIGGCWRSANRHAESTGKAFWARAAQVALVLGVIQAGAQYISAAPALVEMLKIATRTEHFTDYTLTVLENGDEIEIAGYMAFGVEKELEQALENSPNVRIIRLNSPGGRLEPARKVRELIEQRGLVTHTTTECNSACLIAFIAGHYRILNTDAKLGFHSASFPGLTPRQVALEMEKDKSYFLSAGVDAEFLNKAFSVSSEKLWFPEIDELIRSKVITHTFDGKDFVSYIEE